MKFQLDPARTREPWKRLVRAKVCLLPFRENSLSGREGQRKGHRLEAGHSAGHPP